jgi:hypothetical protein
VENRRSFSQKTTHVSGQMILANLMVHAPLAAEMTQGQYKQLMGTDKSFKHFRVLDLLKNNARWLEVSHSVAQRAREQPVMPRQKQPMVGQGKMKVSADWALLFLPCIFSWATDIVSFSFSLGIPIAIADYAFLPLPPASDRAARP